VKEFEYKIVTTQKGFEDLEALVNDFCKRDWIPQGGIVITENSMAQPMIREIKIVPIKPNR